LTAAFGDGPFGAGPYGEGAGTIVELDRGVIRLPTDAPTIILKAVLDFGGRTDDGRLVAAVATPWFEIVRMVQNDPASIYQISWEKWEEIVAGAYKRAGFDEVILTPLSGDRGRDVIATKWGTGSVRFFDQVKVYKPGHLVTAEEVRAMHGVITGALNVSKGVITTTSDFAPRLREDPFIKPLLPYRIELKARDDLLTWLSDLLRGGGR
jgi:restriction system protein